jgi:hypothetical protein
MILGDKKQDGMKGVNIMVKGHGGKNTKKYDHKTKIITRDDGYDDYCIIE